MSPLSSQTTDEKARYLLARAERLGWTRSRFLSKVLDWWFEAGAPAVDQTDAALPPFPFKKNHPEEVPEHGTPAAQKSLLKR